MNLNLGGWGLRLAAVAIVAVGAIAMAPGCSSSGGSNGPSFGGSGATDSGVGGKGGTGGTATGGTGGSTACAAPNTSCGGVCTNTQYDPANCGTCGNACPNGGICIAGTCAACAKVCNGICTNTDTDPANCGDCGNTCPTGQFCSVGQCDVNCLGGLTKCGTSCVNPQTDGKNCGSCGNACPGGQVCAAGQCVTNCGTDSGLTQCGSSCVDLQNDKNNCGACNNACPTGKACLQGTCGDCDVNTQDCDGDGWAGLAEGDCCEVAGNCGANPALVNPGAIEVVGNGIDDNCNGKADLFDTEDTVACDSGLASDSNTGTDYAKAIGICRSTTENPATPKDKTWGLITAEILLADGTALDDDSAKSIRGNFGNTIKPLDGASMVVISSGIASDATQTNPGPNGGAPGGSNVDNEHSGFTSPDLTTCTDPRCIKDWFSTANGTLKQANAFPTAPNCGTTSSETTANDSVMIRLRMRAPTNARAFSFNSYFFSAEYPEYVCLFNDQYIALVDTPSGPTSPIANPVDKNLMTYLDPTTNKKWPIGINIASGTSLFAVCDPTQTTGSCVDVVGGGPIGAASCSLGNAPLLGTGFELPTGGSCDIGGGTYWLTTAGNVIPGDIVELRFVIFDVGDWAFDSTALIDGFKWLSNATLPGTG